MIFKKFFLFFLLFLLSFPIFAEDNIDQWQDSEKTYFDLIQEGFAVKAYDITNVEIENNYILMLFVTVLQKNSMVYECQEYQTLDLNMQTLDMTVICRQLVQPYKKGLGT